MLRIDASPVTAYVVHHVTFWNFTVSQVHRYTMSAPPCSSESEDAIAIPVFVSSPKYAVSYALRSTVKPIQLSLCRVAHFILKGQYGEQGKQFI